MVKSRVLKKITQKANKEQIEKINTEKWLEGEKLGKDPGAEFISEWIKTHGAKFRKDFSLKDLKETLEQLKLIRKGIREKLLWITKMTKEMEDLEEELLIDVEGLDKDSK